MIKDLVLVFATTLLVGCGKTSSTIENLGSWQNNPVVYICDSAPVSDQEVADAVSWWEGRGYTFSVTVRGYCPPGTPFGAIRVELPGQYFMDTHNGETTLSRRDQTIIGAKVAIKEKVDPWVLIHEFGHALGWGHSDHKGHIMYPKSKYYRYKDCGVRKADSLTNQ